MTFIPAKRSKGLDDAGRHRNTFTSRARFFQTWRIMPEITNGFHVICRRFPHIGHILRRCPINIQISVNAGSTSCFQCFTQHFLIRENMNHLIQRRDIPTIFSTNVLIQRIIIHTLSMRNKKIEDFFSDILMDFKYL